MFTQQKLHQTINNKGDSFETAVILILSITGAVAIVAFLGKYLFQVSVPVNFWRGGMIVGVLISIIIAYRSPIFYNVVMPLKLSEKDKIIWRLVLVLVLIIFIYCAFSDPENLVHYLGGG